MYSWRPRDGVLVHVIILVMQDVRSQVAPADGLVPLPLALLEASWLRMHRWTVHFRRAMLVLTRAARLGLTRRILSSSSSPLAMGWITSRVYALFCSLLCVGHGR